PAHQSYFTFLTGIEGPSAEKMMDDEIKGLDLGELEVIFAPGSRQSGEHSVARVSKTVPCNGAFFGSGSLD
ncbi:MAG TPA: hypothetical protein VEF04_01955, partial [Blastocatellia bacterium]|nr:hypothetical protein [Blastocatellia bacterium]